MSSSHHSVNIELFVLHCKEREYLIYVPALSNRQALYTRKKELIKLQDSNEINQIEKKKKFNLQSL